MSKTELSKRFRGYLPVVIDIETGGFNSQTDAILEIAAVFVDFDENNLLKPTETIAYHVLPFQGANLDPKAMAFTGIDPYHPFRFAKDELTVFQELFKAIRAQIKKTGCQRAVLVAHNTIFDMSFMQAAAERHQLKRNPFHPFSAIDTVALSAVFLGQTVLAKACDAAGIIFDKDEAHSAIYDAQRTAELFCKLTNQWQKHEGWDIIKQSPILVE